MGMQIARVLCLCLVQSICIHFGPVVLPAAYDIKQLYQQTAAAEAAAGPNNCVDHTGMAFT
jgi:hypothetical protein